MKSRRSRKRVLGAASVVSLLLALIGACSDNGEGERCESANGNADCQSGLVCTKASQLAPEFATSDRCCPADRATATAPSCKDPSGSSLVDAAPPPDTGPVPEASTEAGVDAEAPDADAEVPDADDPDADAEADAGT